MQLTFYSRCINKKPKIDFTKKCEPKICNKLLLIFSSRLFFNRHIGSKAQNFDGTASGKPFHRSNTYCFRLRSGSICHLINIYDQFNTHFDFTPPTNSIECLFSLTFFLILRKKVCLFGEKNIFTQNKKQILKCNRNFSEFRIANGM